jgi:immune inhibitor A
MKSYRKALFTLTTVCLTLLCAFLFIDQVQASPAAPVDFTVTQPDGTTFTARQWGDEWNNGIETSEGYSITQQEDGWWVYAAPQADGLLGPALFENLPQMVGVDSPEGLALHMRPTVVNENPNSPAAMGITSPSLESPEAPTLTTVKTLVLLADFNNTTPAYTPTSFQTLMFGTGTGSVRDFYRDTSFNNMDIIPAGEDCGTSDDGITDWTELPYNHPNTGRSIGTDNYDIVKDVLVANNGCINFSTFDTNANGYIETSELAIVVVVAGYERSYSSAYSPSIWAHQSWLTWATGGAPQLDGKWIGEYGHGNYAQFGEQHGTHQATIGIMAHEFGHVINWPDLYDTDLSSEGVGDWSIMGGGSWNGLTNSGDSPAMADAWLKWYQGWITPTVVSGTLNNQAIAQAETNATAFLLRPNPGGVDWRFFDHSGTGEYFLVENRQYAGYDAGLSGCGLLIWHIDETVTEDNSANGDETHALVWLEQADGLNELAGTGDRGDTGDPWPGATSKYNFNYSTVPNSRLYNRVDSQVAVHVDSTACGASMQADLTYPAPLHVNLYLPLAKRGFPATSGTIPNGNFESGHANWTEYSTVSGYGVIVNSFYPTSVSPHGGSWGVWLGGVTGYTTYTKYIQQSVTVGSLNPYLSFYQWSASADYCSYDFAYVSVNGTPIYTRDLCTDTDTGGWVRSSLNLTSYVGQTVTLQFRAVTDGVLNSNWFIDDVAFSTTAAPPLEAEEIFPFDPNNLLPQEETE